MLKRISRKGKRETKLQEAKKRLQTRKEQVRKEIELKLAKLRYRKIWLSNYPLFLALVILIGALGYAFKSWLALFFFLAGILIYGILLMINHCNRITKDEKVDIDDYEFAATIMGVASKAGMLYACVATVCMAIFS
ncbi:MAG: hypothetical protein HGA36_03185 [Candidatus Moranbacteria bacterium]|nr:hypothetical protein [Candidatus Moranbacteria bacterium]